MINIWLTYELVTPCSKDFEDSFIIEQSPYYLIWTLRPSIIWLRPNSLAWYLPSFSSSIHEPYALVSWTNCYSCSLDCWHCLLHWECPPHLLCPMPFHPDAHQFPGGINLLHLSSATALSSCFYCTSYSFLFCLIFVHGCLPYYTL